MKKRTAISVITLLMMITMSASCNQVGLGAITATKNFFMAPYKAVKDHISSSKYEEIAARSHSNKSSQVNYGIVTADSTCPQKVGSIIPMETDDYEALMRSTREKICSCRAWGSCTKKLCKCAILCPNNFSIFRRPPFKNSISDLTVPENSLSFRNRGSMNLSSIKGTQGYCWGHASVTTKFNRLASFNPKNKEMRNMLENPQTIQQRDSALEYYKGLIDQIIENKTQSIPGFKNLQDFSSSDPDIQSYIADQVAHSWADRAMSFQGLATTLSSSKMKRSSSKNFINQVVNKIDNNQQPQIVFTKEGHRGMTHTVLVSDYIKREGETILCIRDNNLSPRSNSRCANKMYMSKDGSMYYSAWGSLGKATVADNDNTDALEQFESLKAKCSKDKGCPKS